MSVVSSPLTQHRSRVKCPRAEADLSVEFFSQILPLNDGNSITSMQLTKMNAGGLTGALLYQVRFEFAQADANLPNSVVVKTMDASKTISPSYRTNMFERALVYQAGLSDNNMIKLEAIFYSSLANDLCTAGGVRVPKVYYSAKRGRHNFLTVGMFVAFARREHVYSTIVMEDLTSFKDDLATMPDRLETILNASANLHAHTAKLYAAGKLRDMPECFHVDLVAARKGLLKLVKRNAVNSSYGSGTRRFRRIWADHGYPYLNDPDMIEALTAFEKHYNRRIYPKLRDMYARFPCVLHGDLHAGNFAFLSASEAVMLDWQMYGLGNPVWDVAYLFCISLSVADDPKHDEALLRGYHSKLVQRSGLEYPWPLFRRDFDLAILDAASQVFMRQAYFDSPAALAKQMKGITRVYAETTRIAVSHEDELTLRRLRQIWARDKGFKLELAKEE